MKRKGGTMMPKILTDEERMKRQESQLLKQEMKQRGMTLYRKEERLIVRLIQEGLLDWNQVVREGLIHIQLNTNTELILKVDGYLLKENEDETSRYFRMKDDYLAALDTLIRSYSTQTP